jgi:demethylmenaquinone methyltransferase/2-methoxy-6-polyprenyl-1,4-benzoquinol methylase
MDIGKLFDRIAFRYDLFNSIASFGLDKVWRCELALSLKPLRNIRLLDVAVGTGQVLLSVFESGCDISYAAGIDVSEKMLALAAGRLAAQKVDLKQAKAESLPFENSCFDAVTCAFGVRNFEDLHKGLAQMLRVLKPGGKAIILEFSLPPNAVIRFLYLIYLKIFIPLLGLLITGRLDAYKYLSRTIQTFAWGENFCQILRDAGFSDVKAQSLTFGSVNLYSAIKSF